MSVSIRKPSPPSVASTQPRASAAEPAPKDSPAESRSSARASPHGRINTPTLSQLQGILAMVSNSPEKSGSSQQQPKPVKTETVEQARVPGEGGRIGEAMSADHARIAEQDQVVRQAEQAQLAEQARKDQHACQAEEARQAEEQVLCLEQLQDDESAASASEEPAPLKLTPKQVSESLTSGSKKLGAAVTTKSESVGEDELREEKPAVANAPTKRGEADDVGDTGEDDEDDRPLAEALYAFRDIAQSSLHSRAQHLDNADSDPEEDVPLQDLLQRRSSEAPSGANSVDNASKWPSTPFEPKITRLYSAAPGISIRHFVPIASSALEAQRTIVRNPAAVFDAGVAVSEFGKIATFSEKPIKRSLECEELFPGKMMEFRSDVEGKAKSIKGSGGIDRVEDVRRLTSKVCGIASSTKKPLGLGNHADYPCQVSLVTVNEIGRAHRTYHLDEQPHAWGVASISHFPRTDPLDASSIDFATGGIDGIVNHWHWRARSTNAQTFRLHTLHDANPVVALEHLSSRANVLASASIGTVVGYDLAALTLGFSWNTSDHIVHLQRTPDTKLMLGVMARRDYDQFRMFDVTGRNGPISRPVISFGWLNDSEGKLPLGRGSFHPTRRAIFAHGAEDGRIRVWDMRNARDPLIDVRLGDEPIVEAVWGRGGSEEGAGDAEDLLYVASPKGVRSVSLLAP
ncbi:hypothetical protein EX895_002653 [Sporisorium graminicola]|uniref:WD40 repeat-like protein n=1 Tax=Sporisorium graminicola TaxID=280036 RepID=A0A4U7KUP9_9BASI|nr:hypothetical protein EX895_002653 [Sporisorium graminicola]TKY88301.1 hypothetical protein EX895_002653 [Sporisorium graminicola]